MSSDEDLGPSPLYSSQLHAPDCEPLKAGVVPPTASPAWRGTPAHGPGLHTENMPRPCVLN